jgi:LPS export ABC transporter protein LptC
LHTDALQHNAPLIARRARLASARAKRSRTLATGIAALAIAAAFGLAWQLGWIFGSKTFVSTDPNAPTITAKATAYGTELTGVDKNNLPFKITATDVQQDDAERKKVNLETVNGSFSRKSGEAINIKSDRGQYQTETKMLDLEGGVVIKNSARMIATMEKATVDVTTRKLLSRSPVKVLMDGNEVTADQLVVDNNGEKIKFTGRVKASFGGEQK